MNNSFVRRTRTLALIGLVGSLLAGCGINTIPTFEETCQGQMVGGAKPVSTPADLIPNLVETVKGYAAQEREVLRR